MRGTIRAGAALVVALAMLPTAAQEAPGSVRLAVTPLEATVGAPLRAELVLDLPEGARVTPPDLGTTLGPFDVVDGAWQGPVVLGGRARFTWTGSIRAFETGALEVPAVEIRVPGPSGMTVLRSDPVSVTIRSVLPPEDPEKPDEPPELADLKAPTGVPANYRALIAALLALGGLLALAGVAWWLHRRYAAKLAAVPAPHDPFRRVPPHVWAYEELQRLLDRRLAEEGEVLRFFEELATILKRYLGGRFRLDLLEHTTEEVVPLLRRAGAAPTPAAEARSLLDQCDLVKFARRDASPEACRKAVEQAYRIVDRTKPVEEAPTPSDAAVGAT